MHMLKSSDGQGVPALKGKLPLQCHNDLSALRQFVQSRLIQGTLTPATSPENFKAVLLTGATGFIGRHVLHDLLQRQSDLVVVCLVRATDRETGYKRLRAAMEDVGIWDKALAPRIRVVLGNTELHQFGLPKAEFHELSQQIDAVYHLAANLALAESYTTIRKPNTFSLRVVLDLCLHIRMKHLFFASTMGIFPEYFTDYAKEFSNSPITCQMQPDLTAMKRVFPLGIAGYPWSKLVAEQAFLFAHAAGLPGAIFRLPRVWSSSNGYSKASDICARLSQAVLDVGIKPRGMPMQRNHEPVDMVSAILAAISLNPDRQFTVYHFCNAQHPGALIEFEDFGFDVRESSYETFKRTCMARGEHSPLYGYWTLVDHFAPYWLSTQRASTPLVSEEAMRTDCPDPIHWPGSLLTFSRSFDWIVANRQRWPYAIVKARLDEQHLLELAERCSEQEGVPVEQAFPEWMRSGMGQLLKALNRPEARLLENRVPLVALDRSLAIRKNVALARDWLHHPQIDGEVIERPVFIIGINRTGTTYLHRLMSRDPRFWTMQFYELAEPVLDSGAYATVAGTAEDPRRALAKDIIETMNSQLTTSQLDSIHDLQGDEPEEDFPILGYAFMSWTYAAWFHVPDYASWLGETGLQNAYTFHRRVMKHFTWQRRQRLADHSHTGQWLFKMPFHLMELEALLEAYPDALFIQTHREPAQFMGSWNSLVTSLRSMTSDPVPPDAQGAEQLALMSGMLNQAVAFRRAHPQLQNRWIDVKYGDLVKSPFATLERIYARFGWTLPPTTRAVMEHWQQEQAQARQRQAQAPHRYALEDYGLTRKMVDAAFTPYLDFVSSINW